MDVMVTPWVFAVSMYVGMLICLEIGRCVGIRYPVDDPQWTSIQSFVDGAVFALYGMLLALTISGAAGRLDLRRQLIAEEANAIGTAYLRLSLLPLEQQAGMREQFRTYVDSRLEVFRRVPDMEAVKAALSKSEQLQKEIWTRAVEGTRLPGAHPSAGILLLGSLNEMIDITTTRTMSTMLHPPLVVYGLLLLLSVVCAALIGNAMAVSKRRRWLHLLSFVTVTVISVYVILEIEYPRAGLIRMERKYDQVLVDLRQSMQ